MHDLERIAFRLDEIHPPPSGEHALVDDVDRAVELDALRLELGFRRLDVIDEEGHMGGASVVRLERPRSFTRRVPVLQKLEGAIPELQAHLPQGGARDTDGLAQLLSVEPGAWLVRKLEAEDVVVKADRRIEVLDGDAD